MFAHGEPCLSLGFLLQSLVGFEENVLSGGIRFVPVSEETNAEAEDASLFGRHPGVEMGENVEFAARLYGVERPREAALRALERMRIADRAETPVRALSRGLQQRVSIARAIVHEPKVVLLDEPYTGLDAVGGNALTEMLRVLKTGGASLMLVWAGFVEAFLSQYHEPVIPYAVKIAFGCVELAALAWYYFRVGRAGEREAQP